MEHMLAQLNAMLLDKQTWVNAFPTWDDTDSFGAGGSGIMTLGAHQVCCKMLAETLYAKKRIPVEVAKVRLNNKDEAYSVRVLSDAL